MQFAKTWQLVMAGRKTQTRRVVQPLEFCSGNLGAKKEIHAVWVQTNAPIHKPGAFVRAPLIILERMNRLKWAVARGYHFADKTYAVQPGRGRPAVGRIRLTAIDRERLQDISNSDARAEGIHPVCVADHNGDAIQPFKYLWDSIHTRTGTRWQDNPEVWVLEFEKCN